MTLSGLPSTARSPPLMKFLPEKNICILFTFLLNFYSFFFLLVLECIFSTPFLFCFIFLHFILLLSFVHTIRLLDSQKHLFEHNFYNLLESDNTVNGLFVLKCLSLSKKKERNSKRRNRRRERREIHCCLAFISSGEIF